MGLVQRQNLMIETRRKMLTSHMKVSLSTFLARRGRSTLEPAYATSRIARTPRSEKAEVAVKNGLGTRVVLSMFVVRCRPW